MNIHKNIKQGKMYRKRQLAI